MSAVANNGHDQAIVDITDVFAEAQRVPLHALVVGDTVFDVLGGKHQVNDIKLGRETKSPPVLWLTRSDQPNLWEPMGQLDMATITIIPSLGARGDRSTS